MPGAVKLLLNIVATTAICLATYQLFVRRSWVSVLLNGRRLLRATRVERVQTTLDGRLAAPNAEPV